MMNYELFKEITVEKFKDYLPEEYKDFKLEVRQVEKVNQKLDGLTIRDESQSYSVAPTIYINEMYERYLKDEDLDHALQGGADMMVNAFVEAPVKEIDFTKAKDNIVFQLINTEQNKEMLKDMPNRQFHDLSIIYRWVIANDKDGMQSAVVRNDLADKLGMTEEELFKVAVENTKRIMEPTVKSMNEVMKEMFIKDGMPEEVADMMLGDIPEDKQMYVISNAAGMNGAASMMYEDKLNELANQLESDLYIMPSSIHECIAVSANLGDPYELAEMVSTINMEEVELSDRLSNQVYHYDKDLRKLTMATDTPNKRLDGIVADNQMVYDSKSR